MVARQATTCRKGERVGTIEPAFCASEDAGPHRRNVTASSTRHLGPFGLRVSMRSARASGLRAPRCEQGDEGLGVIHVGVVCLDGLCLKRDHFWQGAKNLVEASRRFYMVERFEIVVPFVATADNLATQFHALRRVIMNDHTDAAVPSAPRCGATSRRGGASESGDSRRSRGRAASAG